MSDACSTHSRLPTWPLMSMPRMFPAWVRTSVASLASWMPPAFPRPPTWTWALTTTGYPALSAAATASSTVSATPPADTGMSKRAKYCLPWYSNRSTLGLYLPLSRAARALVSFVEGPLEPLGDRGHGGPGGEDLCDPELL